MRILGSLKGMPAGGRCPPCQLLKGVGNELTNMGVKAIHMTKLTRNCVLSRQSQPRRLASCLEVQI